jgi:hypothetical protein
MLGAAPAFGLADDRSDLPRAEGAGEDQPLDSRYIAGVRHRQPEVARAHRPILLQRSARD